MKFILLILTFYSFIFKALYSSEFPSLFGCFCEGGIIIGKANKNDFVEINKKRMKILRMVNLFLLLEEILKKKF